MVQSQMDQAADVTSADRDTNNSPALANMQAPSSPPYGPISGAATAAAEVTTGSKAGLSRTVREDYAGVDSAIQQSVFSIDGTGPPSHLPLQRDQHRLLSSRMAERSRSPPPALDKLITVDIAPHHTRRVRSSDQYPVSTSDVIQGSHHHDDIKHDHASTGRAVRASVASPSGHVAVTVQSTSAQPSFQLPHSRADTPDQAMVDGDEVPEAGSQPVPGQDMLAAEVDDQADASIRWNDLSGPQTRWTSLQRADGSVE